MRDRKTIVRVDKVSGYSIIDNTPANDDRLSYGAKGVMYKALTKPDDWKFYIQDFANHSSDGITKVTSYFKELRQAGYIEYNKIRNELGHIIDSEYIFHEKPLHTNEFKTKKKVSSNLIKGFHRNSENPIHGENNTREKQESENLKLLNTDNKLNTDNNKELKEKEILEKETLPETPKSNPLSTSRLMDIKSKLGVIAKRWNQTYLEPSRSNIIYEKERTKFESSGYSISFDAYFDNALRMLEKLSTTPLDKFSPISAVVTIESLLKFDMQQIKTIETWYNKTYPKASNVTPFPTKKEPIRPTYDEKNVEEFMRSFK